MCFDEPRSRSSLFFFFNDTATTEIYTLSLHDALPIFYHKDLRRTRSATHNQIPTKTGAAAAVGLVLPHRSEEHTSELQSPCNLVCRLLLEKKKNARLQPRYR